MFLLLLLFSWEVAGVEGMGNVSFRSVLLQLQSSMKVLESHLHLKMLGGECSVCGWWWVGAS